MYRACPKGVDPYPEIDGVDEEQLIDCYCPDQCSGSLRLAFRGHSTRPIPFDSSAELVKYRLEVIQFRVLFIKKDFSVCLCDTRVRPSPTASQSAGSR